MVENFVLDGTLYDSFSPYVEAVLQTVIDNVSDDDETWDIAYYTFFYEAFTNFDYWRNVDVNQIGMALDSAGLSCDDVISYMDIYQLIYRYKTNAESCRIGLKPPEVLNSLGFHKTRL